MTQAQKARCDELQVELLELDVQERKLRVHHAQLDLEIRTKLHLDVESREKLHKERKENE